MIHICGKLDKLSTISNWNDVLFKDEWQEESVSSVHFTHDDGEDLLKVQAARIGRTDTDGVTVLGLVVKHSRCAQAVFGDVKRRVIGAAFSADQGVGVGITHIGVAG
jgi:hypothetical protein